MASTSFVVELDVCNGFDVTLLRDTGLTNETLRTAFTRYFKWRRDTQRRRSGLVPIKSSGANGVTKVPLFPVWDPLRPPGVDGQHRTLGAQLDLVYEGCREGFDALGEWKVAPLGELVQAFVQVTGRDADAIGEWRVDDNLVNTCSEVRIVRSNRDVVTFRFVNDEQRELHKLVSFVTWLQVLNDDPGAVWSMFWPGVVQEMREPPPATAGRAAHQLTDLQKGIVYEMLGETMHRGFLLHGPAGTGKTLSLQFIFRFLRLPSVWGEDKRGDAQVGTGAVLKGGLQGDMEMKIYALFMRADVAPWLPVSISVDEIDFTAPSRRAATAQDSGGNLWLLKLSGSTRPSNATFFATTNVLNGCLEQLVDRLDKRYVGLLDWDDTRNIITKFMEARWPEGMEAHSAIHTAEWFHRCLLGMTPRALESLRTLQSVEQVQLGYNPWPTLTQGNLSMKQLIEVYPPSIGTDCMRLLNFMKLAGNRLSGRILVDLSRLKEQYVLVDVEVEIKRNGNGAQSFSLAENDASMVVHVPRKHTGRFTTVTFVLRNQEESEAGLWGVFAAMAVEMHASHCTYASDEFLRMVGGQGQGGTDERNRDALQNGISQFVDGTDRCVMVVPLRYARIHKSGGGEGGMASSSTSINAREVWDVLLNSWRTNRGREKRQLFVLVASEEWEVHAVLENNSSMAFHSSAYRERKKEDNEAEQECSVCHRWFGTQNQRDWFGCNHPGRQDDRKEVVRYLERVPPVQNVPKDIIDLAKPSEVRAFARVEPPIPDVPVRAKWLCCGKPFLEQECPVTEHTQVKTLEEDIRRAGHQDANFWWCNRCFQPASKPNCTAIGAEEQL
jgi:hypothetical protein